MPATDATGLPAVTAAAATRALPGWTGVAGSRAAPEQVKDAFEALLVGQLLKPLERSLTSAGLFPSGSAGETYAFFWQRHLGQVLAESLDLFPNWDPAAGAGVGTSEPPAAPHRVAARASQTTAARSLASGAAQAPASAAQASLPGAHATRLTAQAASLEVQSEPPATAPAGSERLAPFEGTIREVAHLVELGANWLRAVILQESGGRSDAVSSRGAQGLMQLLPATAAALGVDDSFDPVQNIQGGARYLASLWRRFGDARLALAAYNAGPSRVETYRGVPPYAETRAYVEGVVQLKEQMDQVWPEGADSSATSAFLEKGAP